MKGKAENPDQSKQKLKVLDVFCSKTLIIMAKSPKSWYIFLGGDPYAVASYRLVPQKPWCTNGRNLCGIFANGSGLQPDTLSEKVKDAIAAGLATGISQPSGAVTPTVVLKS